LVIAMLWPETTKRSAEGALTIGGVSADELAERYGTPLYVFDEATLRGRARLAIAAFRAAYLDSRVVYAGKAYLSAAIVGILADEGLGLDVVSGGELYAGLAAGLAPGAITFHGSNKSEQELREALAAGIGTIVVDNLHELEVLARLTAGSSRRTTVLLRLNPGVDVHTHDKIKTGITDSKFGFPIWTGDAATGMERAVQIPGIEVAGYHAHIGSQLFEPEAYRLTIDALVTFASEMRRRHGLTPRVISPGGGFGIAYREGETNASFEEVAAVIGAALTSACAREALPLPELVVEPGRSIVGPAAVALYRVGAIKTIPAVRTYVSVDGGMADNIRPALYGARYSAALANRDARGPLEPVTIAGKYCESGDVLIDRVELPPLETGDLLAVPAVGAYCLPMASNYNFAPRPAVVLVHEGQGRLIRRRESYQDLLALDVTEDPA
jgi:diaminopimelate decarboxylase